MNSPTFPHGADAAGRPGALQQPHVEVLAPLYVLVSQQAAQPGPTPCRVLCEPIRIGQAAGTDAMVVYLSPLQACIDAAFLSLPAEQYQVVPASAFHPDQMIEQHHGRLPYCLHFAWAASNGCLVVRPEGGLVRLSTSRMGRMSSLLDAIPLHIELNELDCYERMWEYAGLFAHAECHARDLAMNEPERKRHAARALARIPGVCLPVGPINQLALYDLESAHWHFVGLDLFSELLAADHASP